MYGLLVSHLAEDISRREIDVEIDRYLEYTSDDLSRQLESLSKESIQFLVSHPAIVMDEGKGSEIAQVVRINSIRIRSGVVSFSYDPLLSQENILNEAVWKLRTELDIEQFEFSRHHFAFKDRNLFRVLESAGIAFAKDEVGRFSQDPLPGAARSQLLDVKHQMQGWSHAQIDDLIFEIGINALKAGREKGGVATRTAAIVQYALENPGATTADRHLLSTFLLRHGKSSSSAISEKISNNEQAPAQASSERVTKSRAPNRVFIVHGQHEESRNAVVSFLEDIGLKGIVLHDQPNMGRHLLTKFIEEAELVTFAIILMTDDDVGGLKGKSQRPRARQNVILELGYFLSHLGQERVCALVTPNLETPSDFDGIVYIQMDSRGEWRKELTRELTAAQLPVVAASTRTRNVEDQNLSADAANLLRAAATDETGTILRLDVLSGLEIQAGEKVFGVGNSREAAKWDHALNELVDAGLVAGKGVKRQVFELTHLGWLVADSLTT